jgi:hypothetical protein
VILTPVQWASPAVVMKCAEIQQEHDISTNKATRTIEQDLREIIAVFHSFVPSCFWAFMDFEAKADLLADCRYSLLRATELLQAENEIGWLRQVSPYQCCDSL